MRTLKNSEFLYNSRILSFEECADQSLLGEFDEQLFITVHTKLGEKIGEAAFCYYKNGKTLWLCDYFDLGIEIDEKYRNQGIGTKIIELALEITQRTLVKSPNHAESNEGGIRLVQKFLKR